jgi:thiamine monophosphate kinase
MFDLYNYSLSAIFLVGLAVILGASEVGRRFGIHSGVRGGDNVSTLEGAVLGLLALMIGFTFAMALSRFEARRDAVLNEANAIGTTALRARLLPEPQRTEALKLLREYVKIRLDITQRPVSETELMAAIDRSNGLQEALWQQAMAVAAKDNRLVPTGLFIQALNEMIDNQECWLFSASPPSPTLLPDTQVGSKHTAASCPSI